MQATIHQAKTHLSRLIRKVLEGEEVIIANRDKPLVRLQAIEPPKGKRRMGWAKGLVSDLSPDFDAELDDFEEHAYTAGEIARRQARRKKK